MSGVIASFVSSINDIELNQDLHEWMKLPHDIDLVQRSICIRLDHRINYITYSNHLLTQQQHHQSSLKERDKKLQTSYK